MLAYKFIIFNNNYKFIKKIKLEDFDSFIIELNNKYNNFEYIYTYTII